MVVEEKPADSPPASTSAPPSSGTPLPEAIEALTVADEKRDGYDRARFKHWMDEDSDGCGTRSEVLIAEAVTPPEQGARCSLTGGKWLSPYQ